MDAVVFFVIAMAISGMMFYYARGEVVQSPSMRLDGQADPEAVLRVFLHASVGEEMVLEIDGEIHVPAYSEISECLRIELDALALGGNLTDFASMNERLFGILESICSAALDPYLTAVRLLDEGNQRILSLPSGPPDSDTLYASSAELPSVDAGSAYLLTLVLAPSSLPKTLDVGACDLDLGFCVGQASAQLQP